MLYKVLDIFNMKVKNLIWALALVFTSVNAQEYKVKYATGLSDQFRYTEALPIWEEISTKYLQTKLGDWAYVRSTVEAAYMSENYGKAAKWSQILVSKGKPVASDWKTYISCLLYLNKSSRVSAVVDSGLIVHPEDSWLQGMKQNKELLWKNVSQTSEYQVREYKKTGEGDDFGAFPYFKGGLLYVTNEYNHNAINKKYPRTGQYYNDIAVYDSVKALQVFKFYQKEFWIDFIYKNQWREVEKTNTHDGPISFNPDNTMMFLTSNFSEKDIEGKIKYGRLKQRVFNVNGETFEEIEFPFNSIKYSTGHATMDADGNVYFVSDRPGSMGGSSDIWVTKYEDGDWAEPKNLGPFVNTDEDEMFPFISSKGILYFSSYGWNSVGGLDVFMSELDAFNPEHIGSPLNSSADDFAYYVNEETGKGYFSTNRGGFVDRIYAFNKPVYEGSLKANLANCKGASLKGKKIIIKDVRKGKSTTLTTNAKGQTEPYELWKGRSYVIVFRGDDQNTSDSTTFTAVEEGEQMVNLKTYFKNHISKLTVKDASGSSLTDVRLNLYRHNGVVSKFNTDFQAVYTWKNEGTERIDSIVANLINHNDARITIPSVIPSNCVDTIHYAIVLTPKQESEFIRLDMVLYNFDKYDLRPEGKLELDKLVKYMKEHPDLRVELSSHTDSRGSDKYNLKLSKNRAKSCVDYIVSQGINEKLIKAEGFGETKLVNECKNDVKCSVEAHQANRRTELKLITPESTELDNNSLGH